MGGPIDMDRKGHESVRCLTQYVTFNLDLTRDHDLGFSKLNFEIATSQELEAIWHGMKWMSQ